MQRDLALNPSHRALLERFQTATDRVDAHWTLSFLETLQVCDWPLDELDFYGLNAAMFDGMGWTLDKRPDDPAAVASELLAFLRWAAQAGEVEDPGPEYEECCEFLASAEAVALIKRDMAPIYLCPHPGVGDECARCLAEIADQTSSSSSSSSSSTSAHRSP